MFMTAALIAVTAAAADLTARALCHLTYFQDCDSKPDSSFPAADTRALMRGRVVNKRARHNVCYGEMAQQPHYEAGAHARAFA